MAPLICVWGDYEHRFGVLIIMEFIKLTYSQLTFDNKSKTHVDSGLVREEARLPAVSSAVLYEIFPFIIVFGEDMVVQSIGRSLTQILPKLTGQKMNEFFDIVRPLVEFQFNSILSR